jgi:hypothetical protein
VKLSKKNNEKKLTNNNAEVYYAGKAGEFGRGTLTSDFFYEEYILNFLIARRKFTHIALLNGITSWRENKKKNASFS